MCPALTASVRAARVCVREPARVTRRRTLARTAPRSAAPPSLPSTLRASRVRDRGSSSRSARASRVTVGGGGGGEWVGGGGDGSGGGEGRDRGGRRVLSAQIARVGPDTSERAKDPPDSGRCVGGALGGRRRAGRWGRRGRQGREDVGEGRGTARAAAMLLGLWY
eukprot:766709-Rhodomonas_salina.2